jgi:thiamine pyridinylase
MNNRLVVWLSLFSVSLASVLLLGVTWWLSTSIPITLRVALYPYVPDRKGVFYELEREFERRHPGVNIELVDDDDFTGSYYKGGLERADADVYEVDTILLADLIKSKKIVPLSLPDDYFLPEALAAVTRGEQVYAVPHWVCGNFLFYRKDNVAIADAKTWDELLAAVAKTGKLLVDFKGSSGLGEWYFTALADQVGIADAQSAILKEDKPRSEIVAVLKRVMALCPEGYCRNDNLHGRAGYYARGFVRGEYAAYIGYSESLSYGLQDWIENCPPKDEQCLKKAMDSIAVRRLPPFSGQPRSDGVGWVDAFALDSRLHGKKKELALDFIRVAVSHAAYRAVLTPAWNEAPRYLLPARGDLKIRGADLYPQFFAAHTKRQTGKEAGLNARLRDIGAEVDRELP